MPLPPAPAPSRARQALSTVGGALAREAPGALYAVVGLSGFLAGSPIVGVFGALAAAAVYVPRARAAGRGGRDAGLERARRRVERASAAFGRPVEGASAMRDAAGALLATLPVGAQAPGRSRRFTPRHPECREMAEAVYQLRTEHGLGIAAVDRAEHGTAPRAELRGPIDGIPDSALAVRLEAWRRLRIELDGFDDPIGAWLGCVATAERRRVDRIRAALAALLAHRPASGEALMTALEAEGVWVARAAVAIVREDVAALDRVIAEPDADDIDGLVITLRARWVLAPAPDLDGWIERASSAIALTRADLSGAELPWSRLIQHSDPRVLAPALVGALRAGWPYDTRAARALLARDEVRRWVEVLPAGHGLIPATRSALVHLGHAGDVGDLGLIGLWRNTRVGAVARDNHAALKGAVGADRPAGELSLFADAERRGALSEEQS